MGSKGITGAYRLADYLPELNRVNLLTGLGVRSLWSKAIANVFTFLFSSKKFWGIH
ncbi:hypothetical protein [Nostoc sp. UHCC 0251]|uniref:hypothetical protein n=1 Tax=Nostoc sp. UHCC 0251 TaxID=3110240 RepID=UPI002B1FF91F|nr:hypothetical protein [Nostoc sp. UHCC 0251]MEA5628402.1 hypothetical protein [Nostoc sp. UHCC 0251]